MKQTKLKEMLKREITLSNKLKEVLDKEITCLREREYSTYKQLIKRKQQLSEKLVSAQQERRMFFPQVTLSQFMTEGLEEMELATSYLKIARTLSEMNETIELLTQMEKNIANSFVRSIEEIAGGVQTYGNTGDYEISQEVESTVINRRF